MRVWFWSGDRRRHTRESEYRSDESFIEVAIGAVGDGAEILVISGDDVSQMVSLDATEFAALYEGTYAGAPVYGVVAGEPIAMNVTVADGLIAKASAVYLP